MIQCSLSDLIQLSEIIKAEKKITEKYEKYSKTATDPQLREKLQKCAATHRNHYSLLESYIEA